MTMFAKDMNYEDERITNVHPEKDGTFSIDTTGGGFWVPNKGVVPKVRGTARFYYFGPHKGLGCIVRGLFIDGQRVFYKTEAQQAYVNRRISAAYTNKKLRHFKKAVKALNQAYETLPPEFQKRIDGFRERVEDWRPEYEPYESMVCTDAVKIATACRHQSDPVQAIADFKELSWEDQMKAVPGLDEGHSGNSFGAAVYLARLYLTEPQLIPQAHGALCPLVGCAKYGCWSSTQK